MKKILFLFAMMIAVGTVNAAKLYATFGTPATNATYDASTGAYAWTGSTSNLMQMFTFSNGELADYDNLIITISNYNNPVRVIAYYGSENVEIGKFYSGGTKTIKKSDITTALTTKEKALADVTAISFGGRGDNNTGSCTIFAKDVYLENSKFALNATFQTPAGNGNYTAPTYTSTEASNSLMTVFEFANGEAANYDKLTLSFTLVSGSVRFGYYVGSTWTQIGSLWASAGIKTVTYDLSKLGVDLSTITKFSFGGASASEATIIARDVFMTRTRTIADANFGTPGSNATYSFPTYNWTGSTSNLMDAYSFSNGELANFETLDITTSNMSSGANWRAGYVVSSYTNFTGAPYYSAGTKTVDLASYEIDMSTVTKIQMGGNSGSGSIDVQEGGFVLKTRKFTEDQKSTVCLPYALTEAEAAAAGKFYELTSADGTTLNFTEVKTTEANKPYVFIAAKKYPFAEVALTKTPVAGGAGSYTVGVYTFQGVSKKETVPSGVYGFNAEDGAFSKTITDDVTINARRAYITVSGGGGDDARSLDINLGNTTGISTVKTQVKDNDNTIYNLSGQRVGANYKGIVIKNGNKFITK